MFWRLRIVLPSINMIGVAVIILRENLQGRPAGMGFRSLQEVVCYWINAPANMLRNVVMSIWDRLIVANCSLARTETCYSIARIVDVGVFLVSVWVLWYVVGLEIELRGQAKRAAVPARMSLRAVADVFLMLIGFYFVFLEIRMWQDVSWKFPMLSVLALIPYAAWALAFTGTYGHDCSLCISEMRRTV